MNGSDLFPVPDPFPEPNRDSQSEEASESTTAAQPDSKSASKPDSKSAPKTSTIDGNVASRLGIISALTPSGIAIAEPTGKPVPHGNRSYDLTTFEKLDQESTAVAKGLIEFGVKPDDRLVMLVPFGARFISLVFSVLKTGATIVLIDPGIDRKHLVQCLSDAKPDGFIGIPKAQAIRTLLRSKFPGATKNVTVGRRFFWGGKTLKAIQAMGEKSNVKLPRRERSDSAAVIFTTGSTGPPKGVLYTHQTFHSQIDRIADRYDIHRGSRDLACFPLFGLFDAVMGVTTIIPDMDPTKPSQVNPRRLIEAAEQWEVDQAFGSPALWRTVTRWAEENEIVGRPFPSLKRVLSAGAPVPADTLKRLRELVHPEADIHTPYGATEALPIASIESRQIIQHTGPASAKGKGVCVGQRFPNVLWKVIEIQDEPIEHADQWVERPQGKIGELVVTGPMVTERYVVRVDQNPFHKILDQEGRTWHRMGDVGYLDEEDRFWFCGRKAHRVVCESRTLFTIPCEAIFNQHEAVERCALVGLGQRPKQKAVVVIERKGEHPMSDEQLVSELLDLASRNPLTRRMEDIRVWQGGLPVDIRHNSKIFRERIAAQLEA